MKHAVHFMKMLRINGKRVKFPNTAACSIATHAIEITLDKSKVDCKHCVKFLEKRRG